MSETVHELRKAMKCLYITVDATVADDVKMRGEAVIAELSALRSPERIREVAERIAGEVAVSNPMIYRDVLETARPILTEAFGEKESG